MTRPAPTPAPTRSRPRVGAVEAFLAVLLVAVLARGWLVAHTGSPRVQTWLTIFVSIVLQALPFVVLGTVVSAAIAVLVPPSFFARALPRRPAVAVPVAGVAGAVLPGCECGSVPIAGALVRRGVTPAAALAFLLSAPAINPVVLAATFVAFPGHLEMVWARLGASLLASVAMGWLWLRLGRAEWLRTPERPELAGLSRGAAFVAACRTDTAQAGGYLVIGALTAATLNVGVPPKLLHAVGGQPVLSVLVLALVGGTLLKLAVSGAYKQYVKVGLKAYLIAAGIVVLAVAAASLLARRGPDHDHAHGHGRFDVVWLLVLPMLTLLLIAPPALGSYSAARSGTALDAASSALGPLPPGDPVRLSVLDYASRAVFDDGRSLTGHQVTLSGFVLPGEHGWYLVRMVIRCCAADAQPIKVGLAGILPDTLKANDWIAVTGRYLPGRTDKDPVNGEPIPYLTVVSAAPIPAPAVQYES